jgi:hypothetical protein
MAAQNQINSYLKQADVDKSFHGNATGVQAQMLAFQADEMRTANLIAFLALPVESPESTRDEWIRNKAKEQVIARLGIELTGEE